MKINRVSNTLALISMLASSGVHAAGGGIPVFDASTAMNFVQTLANDQTKITALNTQVSSMQKQIDINTGSRGMGVLESVDIWNIMAPSR